MGFLQRFRDVAVAVLLLAVPFFFLNTHLKNPEDANALDRFVLRISGPVQYLAAEAARFVSGVVEHYVYLVDVEAERERLAGEVGRLREENVALRTVVRENARLRGVLGMRERLHAETLTAEVIGREISRYFRVVRIRLGRGEHDRVRAGMPVVAAGGLVGQIQRTAGRYSDVRLVVDAGSRVDVVVHRTGARGMLRGTGESGRYLCHVEHLAREDEVAVGDEVFTSGLGQRFPPAILVGRVSRVVRKEFGLYQEVEVRPAVDFSSLDEVLVVLRGSVEQELAREAEGGAP